MKINRNAKNRHDLETRPARHAISSRQYSRCRHAQPFRGLSLHGEGRPTRRLYGRGFFCCPSSEISNLKSDSNSRAPSVPFPVLRVEVSFRTPRISCNKLCCSIT